MSSALLIILVIVMLVVVTAAIIVVTKSRRGSYIPPQTVTIRQDVCAKCGATLEADDVFCEKCGTRRV